MEDVTSHLMPHLSPHPTLRICSSDTIMRAVSELTTTNTTYTSDTGRRYDFNTATKPNSLPVKVLPDTGQLMGRLNTKAFGLKKTSRIKAFVFRFFTVPAKWIRTARQYQLNIYTDNKSYRNPFAFADGQKAGFAGQRQRKAPVTLDGVRRMCAQILQIHTVTSE